jgi:hypothetical protein
MVLILISFGPAAAATVPGFFLGGMVLPKK